MSEILMFSQLRAGRGVNSNTGKPFGTALTFEERPQIAPNPDAGQLGQGQDTQLELLSITSRKELAQAMNVSASASFKSVGGGISGEAKFVQSREINSYYTYALVKVVVTNPPMLIYNAEFTPKATELLVKHGWNKFEASYGAEYVDGYISGGSYYGLIEIQTTDSKSQMDAQAKLSGHYGGFSGSAEISGSLKEISADTHINVFVHRVGGDSSEKLATTVEPMIEQAVLFADQAKKYPVPFIALIADYKSTIPLPDIQDSDSLSMRHQRDCLKELGERYLDLQDYADTLKFVLKHLNGFAEFKGRDEDQVRKEFQSSLDSANQEIDEIVNKATACSDDFTKCELHTPKTQFLKLPGGDLMYLKELEEKLAQLTSQVEKLEREAVRYDTEAKIQSRSDSQFLVHEQATGSLTIALVDEARPESNTPRFRFMIRKVIN